MSKATVFMRMMTCNVMQALQWLKQQNPLYSDVTITSMNEDIFNGDDNNGPVTESESNNELGEEVDIEMDETGIVRLDAIQPNVVAADVLHTSQLPLHITLTPPLHTGVGSPTAEEERELDEVAAQCIGEHPNASLIGEASSYYSV